MDIDGATRRNLEITQTMTGEKRGSLLHTIDRTLTAAGAIAGQRISGPSSRDIINRQDQIECLRTNTDIRGQLHLY